ncbi:hypothetical protein [Sphingopyxis sp.]|jgi:hypothetical protein|uniref:DUF7946 domain-containing protein n=1 Tax=Sphingopyxis sp. TaxID=1908224 RepID=UPI002DE47A67|nr:hypothetical protein [Sphingopyxis sp.]
MATLIVSFLGGDADEHRIEAFSGLESAAGIARALALIGHYAATGEVRYRYPFSTDVQFFLEGTEEGSFNWKFKIIAGTVAVGLATNAIYDLGKLVLNMAVGNEPTEISEPIEELDRKRSGDIGALVEAVEPALKKGHYGIGNTIEKIEIYEESSRKTIVYFDQNSKNYLQSTNDGGNDIQLVTISALNANDRTGRAYFPELGRTVRFVVDRRSKAGTMAILSRSLDHYISKVNYPVSISYRKKVSSDGRLKSIEIFSATDPQDDDFSDL